MINQIMKRKSNGNNIVSYCVIENAELYTAAFCAFVWPMFNQKSWSTTSGRNALEALKANAVTRQIPRAIHFPYELNFHFLSKTSHIVPPPPAPLTTIFLSANKQIIILMSHFHVVFYTEDFLQRGNQIWDFLSLEYCIICIPRILPLKCVRMSHMTRLSLFPSSWGSGEVAATIINLGALACPKCMFCTSQAKSNRIVGWILLGESLKYVFTFPTEEQRV